MAVLPRFLFQIISFIRSPAPDPRPDCCGQINRQKHRPENFILSHMRMFMTAINRQAPFVISQDNMPQCQCCEISAYRKAMFKKPGHKSTVNFQDAVDYLHPAFG